MQNTSFKHSIKVPKLYKCAAKLSREVAEGRGSVKQLVYEQKHFNTKALYALVVTSLQKSQEIDLLLKRTNLLHKENRLDPWLAKILISELLWGKKQLPKSEAKPIQTIQAYEQAFYAHLSDSSRDNKTENITHKKPRYVRINTLVTPYNEAVELFQDEGWILQTPESFNDYQGFLDQVSNLQEDSFLKDLHIPNMLIFPGGTEFYNHPGYKKGSIILQDKASCLPVHILSPTPGSIVLDMCAAPGMKTTQLAALLQDKGTVYAVERDPKRFEVLIKMVSTSGATCIKTLHKDVLECGSSDFPDVEYILVDPSCSGSGMTDRLGTKQVEDPLRLQKLAGFQIKILRSALTRYPKVKRVVYSTCSLCSEENEDVVRQVLETNDQFKLVPAKPFVNEAWKNCGSLDFGNIGAYCLYAKPEEDLTNGFFVAVFERLEEEERNRFFNGRVLNYRKKIEYNLARKEKKQIDQFESQINKNGALFEDKRKKKNSVSALQVDKKLVLKNGDQEEIIKIENKKISISKEIEEYSNYRQDTDNVTANEKHKKRLNSDIHVKLINEIDASENKGTRNKEKKNRQDTDNKVTESSDFANEKPKKKHKKRLNTDAQAESINEIDANENTDTSSKEKKKKRKHREQEESIDVEEPQVRNKKKNKKSKIEMHVEFDELSTNVTSENNVFSDKVTKKKKKAKHEKRL